MYGKIMKSVGSWYKVKCTETGTMYEGRLRGKLRQDDQMARYTNPVAVGDVVRIEPQTDDQNNTVTIEEVMPRKNHLIRRSAQRRGYFKHVIAANIDQLLIIASLTNPKTATGFIDRLLVSAQAFGIDAYVVYNKTDLHKPKHQKLLNNLTQVYQHIGYKVLHTSAMQNQGIEELKAVLENKTTLLSGNSGVGKSTLINQIEPSLNLKADAISNQSKKGVHTTTFAEMHPLSHMGYVIDTPGLKEFGLTDIEPEEVGHYFPEMVPRLPNCKYHNCLHNNEPNCAVIEAVLNQQIAPSRYETYLSLIEDTDTRNKQRNGKYKKKH